MLRRFGTERTANTTVAGAQSAPAVAALERGGFVVAWQADQANGGSAITMRRFDAGGMPLGAERVAASHLDARLTSPAAAGLAGGGWWIAYESGTDLNGLVFDAAGKPVRSQSVSLSKLATDKDRMATLLRTGTGSHACWVSGTRVFVRSFGADGAFGPSAGIVPPGMPALHFAAAAAVGEQVSAVACDHTRIWLKRDTRQSGPPDLVRDAVPFVLAAAPAVAALDDDAVVVAWNEVVVFFSRAEAIVARIVRAGERPPGTSLTVKPWGDRAMGPPAVLALRGDGFVVGWTEAIADEGPGSTVRLRAFADDGTRLGREVVVNSGLAADWGRIALAELADGLIAVAWTSAGEAASPDVRVQLVDPREGW